MDIGLLLGRVWGTFFSPVTLSQAKQEENPGTPVNGFIIAKTLITGTPTEIES